MLAVRTLRSGRSWPITRTASRRTVAVVAVTVATATAVLAPAGSVQAAGCPTPASTALRAAPGSGTTVALTFDDGPGPETTRVLAILRRYNVRATFFVVGSNVPARRAAVRQVVADGHLVANHSYSHPSFASLTSAQQARQLDAASDAIGAAIRTRPCWFRPPYGAMNAATVPAARAQGMSTVIWNVDTRDWAASTSLNSADSLSIRVRARAGTKLAHPMVLFHDGGARRPNMLHELPGIIVWYRSHGYRFVGLDGREMTRPARQCDVFTRLLTQVKDPTCSS